MKSVKMSLVAGLLLGANLYAVDNVEVSGDARLFYGTGSENYQGEAGLKNELFSKESSYAEAGFSLGVTADLMENVKVGAKYQIMSQLGMDNSIADSSWSNSFENGSGALDTEEWMAEAWVEAKMGNTTAKVGRQIIETPLVFTETWSVDYNTFEAGVLVNEDISDTTIVGAWIGQSNGAGIDASPTGNITNKGGRFDTIGANGAGVIGVTNNSFKPLTAQAWYYDITDTAEAIWLQADYEADGFVAGAQYTTIDMEGAGADDSAYAAKIGYVIPDVVTLTAAYSSVDDEGTRGGVYNFATEGQFSGTASSLYTEFWWWFQTSSATGADTWTVSAESTVADTDLFLGYYSSDSVDTEVDEIAFTASKSFGALDTSLAVIYDMFGDTTNDELTTIQLYLTYNF